MKTRHHIAIAAAVALSAVAVGLGGAIAATKLTPKQESQAVLEDAAEQLGVQPSELSDALKQALRNRVDAAVADGRLTKEQGQELKERIEAGDAPLLGLPPRGFGLKHLHMRPKFEAAATYLGMTSAQLRAALDDGKTLAQVARDRNKSVDGLIDAIVAEARKRFGADVPADLRQRITDLVNGRLRPPHFHRHRHGGGAAFIRPTGTF